MIRLFTILALCLCATFVVAQGDVAVYPPAARVSGKAPQSRPSPMSVAAMTAGDAYVKVIYSRPQLKGREMIGKKEPYGKVWRLGANEATELFSNVDLTIGGETVPAGAYSLFAIPSEGSWTLIVSNQHMQWGAYQYDDSKDQARIEADVQASDDSWEAFTIWFAEDGGSLNMAWGNTMVSYPVAIKG